MSLEAEASHASKVRSGTTEDSKTVQPVLDISLDDVFAGTSGGQSKKQSIDFDKYIQRGRELKESSTGGFNTTVRNVDAVDVCPRKSSLPDANITMEELFDEIKTQPVIPHVKNFHGKLDSVNSEKREKLFESDNSIDDICLNRQESLPTPPNSLCDSSEELFIDSSLPVEEKDSDAVSDDDDENTDHRTRSRSVTSMNGKKVFTVTFPGQTDDVEEAEPSILSGPRPEATRKIRKPTPNIERTSVFDIFNIISGDNAEEEKNLKESNDSDDTSSASSSFIQMERRPIIPRIHSTSLTVSLDDLGRSEHENSHIITSQAYELPEGFPTAVPSRRASRYSVRTDELDENISCHNYVRTKTRTHNSDFSDFYNDLKSPPRTPIKLKRRSIDFYYEEPMEMPVEEEVDVQDFVDEILNQSLDEAAFLATSKHMSFKKEVPRSTDTSIDRKQSEADSQIFSDMAFSSISANSEHMTDHVFVSSTNRNSLYEAILTCPETDNVPLSPTSYPREEQKMETIDMNIDLAQKTFISEASVVLKENQSEDYIVRLLFPEKPEETIIVQEDYEESDDQSKNTTNVTSNIKHIIEKMAPQQKDDEYLEVEVNSEYFIIHGKYSMIIHKTEPLGEMLSKIQTSSLDFTVTPKLRKILRQCLHNKISGNNGTDISSRAFHMLNRADPAYDNLNKMALNRFTENNRSGNINFCTAENMVCRPLLQHRIRENLNIVEEHLFHYAPGGGYDDVKETILGYLKKFMRGTHVQKRDLTLVGSGNTCYDLICHCLYESEDVILTNTPSYARLFLDCSERAGCRVEAVPMDLNKLEIDLQAFEKVLNEQREQGNTVKGIVLINPNNPLGITFPKSQVLALGDWASGNDLSLIVDESFSNSNYGDGESESFLSYQHELKNPSKAVWFWSLSKDFGLPGVKIATLHTPNPSLNEAISALELIYPVSALAQDFASNLLSDYDWAEQFHKTKNYRIGKHYEFVAANLRALNLDFITATSGFYVLVDFRQKMKSRTFEEEDKVWHLLIANGVFMTRGKDMRCAQPGWMRLVFGCDKDQVEEGIRRLHKMFGSTANVIGSINY
ncbi:unnamed protein product [Auanema sp. JU1783]|nr:unnamed protein product [Auanema sp. JU1783]